MTEPIFVEGELFLGRFDEQGRFYSLLEAILKTERRGIISQHSTDNCSYVALLHGEAGMGKTALCKRFRDIAQGQAPDQRYKNKFNVLWLDWEVHRDRDPRLANRDSVTFETVLDHLYSTFREAGLGRRFKSLEQERLHRIDVVARVERELRIPESTDRYAAVRKFLAKLGAIGAAAFVQGIFPVAGALLPQEETAGVLDGLAKSGAAELAHLRIEAEGWLRRILKNEYELFISPEEILAHALAHSIRTVSQRKPLVLFLDTYEIIYRTDYWLRRVMQQSGPKVVWVISGRDNLAETRHHGGILFRGYQGEVPAERLRVFPLSEFSEDDVAAYFMEKVRERPLSIEQAIAIQQATYGIPLAVKTAAAIWSKGVPLEAITEGFPRSADRETIVKEMTERFLVHARADSHHPEDVPRLYALSLAHQPDYDLLSTLLQVQDLRPVLDDLERRYDFVVNYSREFRTIPV